ncbi:NAD(P)/FAD-dependent oxidoreductase [Streptomyces yaizuensis]|uniref:FAD-dependent monooxygenase n=1 Tax=Streptomyces yaizuensis TaxID=2989713 RepID=A0ABQ5P675_9ACTN|nr:FAD-dependent monooxygenase [Streptomyces sp. YSPA8]GLF98085.1 FAD-dependent monooxygenase [Streptomyces sp. YSPA8]
MNLTPSARPAGPHAVIIGGGLAGMLAAAALAPAAARVTVIERDALPTEPAPRRGLPQARHAHLLWSGGARAIESLLPGVQGAWLAAGARRISLPTGVVAYTAEGWMRRFREAQYLIACSRDLLDAVVRSRVLQLDNVELRHAQVTHLTGTATRITGVTTRCADGTEETIRADFVVDASGRGSRSSRWLTDFGVPPITETTIDSGLTYATRLYHAPPGADEFPLINIQSNPADGIPGQTATIMPIEGQRWLVTLSGTRGGEPTDDPDRFVAFARSVRHPLVAELIEHAKPLDSTGTITISRSGVNKRRYYERMKWTPEGYLILGDAVATYNPVFGHGMTVAAVGAKALADAVRHKGITAPGLSAEVQRTIARSVSTAWDLATGQDIRYPGCIGPKPPAAARLLTGYVSRLTRTAASSRRVAAALMEPMTLSGPAHALVRPSVLLAVARGPIRPPLTTPPLTPSERALAPKPRTHQR